MVIWEGKWIGWQLGKWGSDEKKIPEKTNTVLFVLKQCSHIANKNNKTINCPDLNLKVISMVSKRKDEVLVIITVLNRSISNVLKVIIYSCLLKLLILCKSDLMHVKINSATNC